MKLKSITSAFVALSLGAAPALAGPVSTGTAASANPASSLSLASGTRIGQKAGRSNKLSGGVAIFAALIVAGIIAIPVIDALKNDRPSSP